MRKKMSVWFSDPKELVKPKQFLIPTSKGGTRKLLNFLSMMLVVMSLILKKLFPTSNMWYKFLAFGGIVLMIFNLIIPPDKEVSVGDTVNYEGIELPEDIHNIYL